jgi:hypothetical protein
MAHWIALLSLLTIYNVIYKFALVWYSLKQGTIGRPTSYFLHLNTVPFQWSWAELKLQWSMLILAGQCLLVWLSRLATFVEATLGLPTKLGVGRSWLLPASLTKFLTRRRLKSQRICFAPPESICWVLLDWEGGKTILWPTWRYIDSSNNCWPYNQNCRHTPCSSLYRSMMRGVTG